MKAIRYPNVQTVQIIFNMFRLKPAETFFADAADAQGRHPRAGAARERAADRQADGATRCSPPTITARSTAKGEAFDKGETFSGVPYDVGARRGRRVCARSHRRASA